MAIDVACTCGYTTRVKDEHAGKRTKCPICNAAIHVPARNDEEELPAEDFYGDPTPPGAAVESTSPEPLRRRVPQPPAASQGVLDEILTSLRAVEAKLSAPRPVLEYKVITGETSRGLEGLYVRNLEEVINSHASQGWTLTTVAGAAAEDVTIGVNYHGVVVIMERPR